MALKDLLDYEGDVEDDFCLTFQVMYLSCFHLYTF